MKKYGFTLIELLAVITILAIVAIIAVPAVVNVIEDARQGSFKNSAYGIIKAAEHNHSLKTLKDSNPGVIKYTYKNGVDSSKPSGHKLEYKGQKPKDGTIIINEEGQTTVAIHDGTYCVEKNANDSEVTISKKNKEECNISPQSTFTCGNYLLDSRDNNTYKTVKIGDQCWMAENLKYTGNGCAGKTWNDTAPHDACQSHSTDWGEEVLYQWGAAMNGSTTEGVQGLCPDGWHIPTDDEWKTLEMYLGMTQVEVDKSGVYRGTNEGNKLKGLTHSWCTGTSGCGESGFNASPAGGRYTDGSLDYVGSIGFWWTSTLRGSNALHRNLNSGYAGVSRDTSWQAAGRSVRCLLG